MAEEFRKVESLIDRFKEYVNTRVAQLKLSMAEKVSKTAAALIAILLAALVFFLFLVLLSTGAAILIGKWLNHLWLGFAIMAFVVLIITLLIWKLRHKWLQIPLMNVLLATMFDNEEEEDEED